MQVAAANPGYLNETEVPAEVLEKEKEILKVQAINEGKPEAIAEKMVQGRIKKFYKENCLMDQEFIKDGDQTIKSYTEAKAKELGGKIEILSFVRYEKGEGIEKRNDDFAKRSCKHDEISDFCSTTRINAKKAQEINISCAFFAYIKIENRGSRRAFLTKAAGVIRTKPTGG